MKQEEIDIIKYFDFTEVINKEFLNSEFELTINCNSYLMDDVVNNTIGSLHLNKLSKLFDNIRDNTIENTELNRNIIFKFGADITNIDIAIVGLVAILKQILPSLKFQFQLKSFNEFDSFAKFRDNLSFVKYWYKDFIGIDLFTLSGNEKANIPIDQLFVFPINEDTFHNYFVSTESSWNAIDIFENVNIKEFQKYFTKYKLEFNTKKANKPEYNFAELNYDILKSLARQFQKSINFKHNNRLFYQEYIKMLASFHLAHIPFTQIPNIQKNVFQFEKFRRQNFSELAMNHLREKFNPLHNKLLKQPSFFIYLFCFLVNRNLSVLDFSDAEKNNERFSKPDFLINRLNEIFEFTNNLFKGLREIARNIIDHTDAKFGVITARVNTDKTLFELKGRDNFKESGYQLSDYSNKLNSIANQENTRSVNDFFDISIFDAGKVGVVKKTLENVQKLVLANAKNEYKADIAKIESGEVDFSSFFDTNVIALNHHLIRTASHWGLIIFSNLLNKNKAFLIASSKSYLNPNSFDICHCFFNEISKVHTPITSFEFGTFYNIILPLDKNLGLNDASKTNENPKQLNFSATNYYDLLKYKFITDEKNLISNDKDLLFQINIASFISEEEKLLYRTELNIGDRVGQYLKSIYNKNKYFIPVLNFENYADDFDQSKLMRFLAQLQLNHKIEDIIVTNIKTINLTPLKDIVNDEKVNLNDTHFWNERHFVLIYSYEEIMEDLSIGKKDSRIYYTDILGGFNYSDLKILRNKLASTHNAIFKNKYFNTNHTLSKETLKGIGLSKLFKSTESGIIQNFELLLKFNNKSYFEISLENELNRKVADNPTNKIGFKIENTHFRLGSKTHISGFVYAKRIFQNSFYSDRFAFIVAKYIKEFNPLNTNTTLYGYGDYSQLLVNRTTEILKKIYTTIDINNDIVSDIEELKFIKEIEPYSNILIIVPINTTFSTAIKIEKEILRRFPNIKREGISPVNLILVSHKNLEDQEYVNNLNNYLKNESDSKEEAIEYPYKLFRWKFVNYENKIATVLTNKDDEYETFQKYFITIPSKWTLPEQCEKCFPKLLKVSANDEIDYRIFEKPLLDTDKVSVTPSLLLNIPKNYTDYKNVIAPYFHSIPIILNEESLITGHLSYRKKHYLHFVEPINFFSKYKEEILKWAEFQKSLLLSIDSEINSKSILLISTSNNSNAYFIEFVNKFIFKDSAIIYHYEPGEDYIENYEKFFSNDIRQAEYIFFVDDFIHSGNTFHSVNDFVRYCKKEEHFDGDIANENNKGCNGVFVLINKSDNYSFNDIISLLPNYTSVNGLGINIAQSKLKLFGAFYQWKDNYIKIETCPICTEQKRYKSLSENSMLDTVKHYFLNKSKNLTEKVYNPKDKKLNNWLKFHPLVIEDGQFPWKETSTKKSKELWLTFKEIHTTKDKCVFPSKNYLKVLIQHSVNELLSEDEILIEFFNDPITNKSNIEYQQHHIDLFELLISKLLQKEPYKGWVDGYNNCTKIIFINLFKEVVIKILTQQPFKNVKSIREKIFTWLLIELCKTIKYFLKSSSLSFSNFRYIKFLLRRATFLGSNFIIDEQTLRNFREIFKKYSPEEKNRLNAKRASTFLEIEEESKSTQLKINELAAQISNLNDKLLLVTNLESKKQNIFFEEDSLEIQNIKNELKTLNSTILELEMRVKYLIQAKDNLIYKEISLKEFGYFYVSLIKELTINNESKLNVIESNVNNLIEEVATSNEKDFHFLLRLIKFENISILNNSIEQLVDKAISDNIEVSLEKRCYEVREVIKKFLKVVFDNYKYNIIKDFFQINDINIWLDSEFGNYFIHLIYLSISLRKENEETKNGGNEYSESNKEFNLEAKTQTIIKNLYRMICDPDFELHNFSDLTKSPYDDDKKNNGAFVSLKFKGNNRNDIPSNNIIITNATLNQYESFGKSKNISNKLIETEIDNLSLSYHMLNGVTNIEPYDTKYSTNTENEFIKRDYPPKPWTLLELSKVDIENNNYWEVLRGNIYPTNHLISDFERFVNNHSPNSLIEYYFNEFSVIDESCNYIIAFRLADLRIEENNVINEGRAVFVYDAPQS